MSNQVCFFRCLVGCFTALTSSGCSDWQADPDGLTEADVVMLSSMRLTGVAAQPTNPFSKDARVIALGQQLFFDKGLSLGKVEKPNTWTAVACADCHSPTEYFSDSRPENNVSAGVGLTTRNAPALVNVGFYKVFSWDGRSDSVWAQCDHAYRSPATMKGSPALLLGAVSDRYAEEYLAAFGNPPRADTGFYRNILFAWGAYLGELTSANAPFDRFLDEREALTAEQRRGLRLFIGKAGCIECHKGPLFTDNDFHSVGIGQSGRGVPEVDTGRHKGILELRDAGFRQESTVVPSLEEAELRRGQFRTKGLRQVARTGPYFHAGQLATLKDVVWYYAQGGDHAGVGTVSPFMVPLGLTDEEQADLVSFLESLTGAVVPAALSCDNAKPLLTPGSSTDDAGVLITLALSAPDTNCVFGGFKRTATGSADGGSADAGSVEVVSWLCNGAPPVSPCPVVTP